MSLVSEALKRARQEAARQEAAAKGLPTAGPPLPRHMPLARAGSAPTWLYVLAGLGVGAAIALGLVLILSAREPAPPRVASAAPPAPAHATASPSVPARQTLEPTLAAPRASLDRSATGAAAVPEALRPSGIDAGAEAPASPTLVATPPAAVRSAAPAPTAAPTAAAVARFSRQAELADGTRLVLQGIALAEERAVALVNGVAVGPGESIAGFRVLRIEATEIELERSGERVVLTLN